MTFDDLLVRNDVQRIGVNASIDWIRQCIAHAQGQGIPDSKLSSFILDMYLLADLRTLGAKALLPAVTQTPHKQILFGENGQKDPLARENGGGAILQILEIQDIGVSSLKMLEACDAIGVAGDEPNGLQVGKSLPQGNLCLDLTDGTRLIRAILLEPIFGIAMEMMLGAKIRVRNTEVRHGMLLLSSKNTFLLGGEVASLNEYPRRLVIMDQMKKRLGLPMDSIPKLNRNGTNTASVTPTTGKQANGTMLAAKNDSSNSNTTSSTNFGWKNPQPAVSAMDAVPSRTLAASVTQQISSNITNNNNDKTKDIPFNPWKNFQKIHNSPSPPPPQINYDDGYLRDQRDQELVWDHIDDIEFDRIDMPGDDGGWEVMSQRSVNGEKTGNDIPDAAKSRSGSPPLIATLSPSKRTSFGRRNLSLRAPHSQDREKIKDEWEVDRLPKTKTKGSNGSQDILEHDDDFADTSLHSSPKLTTYAAEYHQVLIKQQTEAEERTMIGRDYGDHSQGMVDIDENPFQDHESEEIEMSQQKKRKASTDSRSSPNRDHYPSRRRSQSFSISNWHEEETKVEIKLEPGTANMLDKPSNGLLNFNKNSERLNSNENMSIHRDSESRRSSPPIKIKVETVEANTISHHTVIDLSSDEDDTNNEARSTDSQGIQTSQVSKESISQKEDQKKALESWVPVKKEETVLEFEIDDEHDFGGLAEVIPIIPLVELTSVKDEVYRGLEVKARGRIYRLGKFSLTTMSVSIPIVLVPVEYIPGTPPRKGARPILDPDAFTLECILEQRVVEKLFQYSITEFRSLVRYNEAEARRAVANLRAILLEVEQVECCFKGLRGGHPVARELTILTKKPSK
ncbi:hypothetical protein FBU30_010155 [Linnemannia zychae]|nr:hypothetical protein FBU30_010155 [Linnemannia zychae]